MRAVASAVQKVGETSVKPENVTDSDVTSSKEKVRYERQVLLLLYRGGRKKNHPKKHLKTQPKKLAISPLQC